MSPRPNLSFCACKTAWFAPEWQVYMGSSPLLFLFFMQNSDFRTRLTSLYWSNTSRVVLSIHNSVLSTRIKRLYGFQPSSVVLWIQNSDLRTKIACLYGSQSSPVIFFMQNSVPSIRITSPYGSQPSWVVYAYKTATLDRNNKSLWVPDITCRFVYANRRDLHQNDKSISVPALIFLFFSCKTPTLGPDLQVCMGPRPNLWFWAHITACLAQE